MFVLKKPTALSDEFEKEMIDGLKKRIQFGREHNNVHVELSADAKNILLPNWNTDEPDISILKQLLVYEPVDLKDLMIG